MQNKYRFSTLAIIASIFLGVALSRVSEYLLPPAHVMAAVPRVEMTSGNQSEQFRLASKHITPTVVNITVLKRTDDGSDLPVSDLAISFHLHRHSASFEPQGIGSGFIIDSDNGYVVTNSHVVTAGTNWTVRLADKREFEATLVGMDAQSDVAILRINAKDLKSAQMGDSDSVEVGDWVLAVGNPFGLLENSVTAGIISAKGRRGLGSEYEDYIQTDAAINMGNSGGPLVSLDGQVIGLNSAIMSSSGGYQGIGFAIPINRVKAIVKKLVHDGVVTRGWLDMRAKDTTVDGASMVKVIGVHTKGPAEAAGLKSGDIILTFNGKDVRNCFDLHDLVADTEPGAQRPMDVNRDGKRETIHVTVGAQPADTAAAGSL